MYTCLIGGGGFIGSYLVDELINSGRDVLVLGRKAQPAQPINPRAKYIQCDFGCRDLLAHHIKNVEEIIHLAHTTVPKTSFSDPLFDLQSNLPSNIGLIEEALKLNHLKTLLFVSSGGTVYGPKYIMPISEEELSTPISPYGISKQTIERYMLMYHHVSDLPSIIVRPANAYGKGQKPFTGQGFIATAMGFAVEGNPITLYGQNGTVRDYVHVKDIAKGILAALTHGQKGQKYNIGTGLGRNNREVLELIQKFASKDGININVKVEQARRYDVDANVLSYEKLRSCSGWKPQIQFDDGVYEMWQHLKNTI
jgi:UDP-glucose 4-epimerase